MIVKACIFKEMQTSQHLELSDLTKKTTYLLIFIHLREVLVKKNTCSFEQFPKHLKVTFGALLLDKFRRVQSMNVAQTMKNAKRFLHQFAQTGKL